MLMSSQIAGFFKLQDLKKKLSDYAFSQTSMELMFEYVIFVGCCRACPGITNHQYLWKDVIDCLDLLNVVRHPWKRQIDPIILIDCSQA